MLKPAHAQFCEWARSVNTASRPHTVAVREDLLGNNYFASFTETGTTMVASYLEKTNAAQQSLWKKTFAGNIKISDVEINSLNHTVTTGSFEGAAIFDNDTLLSPNFRSAFFFEADETGVILWIKKINPVNDAFEPVDLFIATNDNLYFTSELNGGSNLGFCAFHKMDPGANNLQNEFNSNFENRTYSHIISDSAGNIVLSGTCGNFATFDGLTPSINASYQHFLAGYDSGFNAQWLLNKPYITFDHNNNLGTDGQNYFWVFDDFNGNDDTVKVLKVDATGQVLSEFAGPFTSAFFVAPYFSVDKFGNSVLLYSLYQHNYIFRYDANFNLLWSDTIATGFATFEREIDVRCYDSSFYIFSRFNTDTMEVSGFTLYNLNSGANFPVDLYAGKWNDNQPTGITDRDVEQLVFFPNPANNILTIKTNGQEFKSAVIYDINGIEVYKKSIKNNAPSLFSFSVAHLNSGIYSIILFGEKNAWSIRKKLVIVH